MIKKLFTLVVVLFPILGIYISPISGFDLGTFCLLLLLPFLLSGNFKIRIPLYMFLLIMYILLGSLIAYTVSEPSDLALAMLRMGKFIITVVIVFIIAKEKFFDYQFAKKMLKIITISAVSYIIIQSILFYKTGRLLPSVPFNLIRNEEYGTIDYSQAASIFYRPASFFLEPAHFAQYVVVYLTYCLFGDFQKTEPQLIAAVFITIGLFVSTSGQGILLSFLIWTFWLFNQLAKSGITRKIYLIIFCILLGLIVLPKVFQTEIVSTSINRIITDSGLGVASKGRLFSYYYFNELPLLQKIIGTGYGNVPAGVYLNSAAYILYCNGIIGMVIVGMLFYDAFRHARYFQRYLCIIYALLIMGSATFTASGIVFYFMFIYSDYNKRVYL